MKQYLRPWAVTVLSFVIAGLGHLYLGKYAKGLLFIFLEVVAFILLWTEFFDVLAVFVFSLQIWVSLDAYRIALKQGNKEQVSNNELTIRTTITNGTDKSIKEINNKEKEIYV